MPLSHQPACFHLDSRASIISGKILYDDLKDWKRLYQISDLKRNYCLKLFLINNQRRKTSVRTFYSGFFRDSQIQIPIPIPGILGFSGFFDLAKIKKSRSRIPVIGIWDSRPRKNPIPVWKFRILSKNVFILVLVSLSPGIKIQIKGLLLSLKSFLKYYHCKL